MGALEIVGRSIRKDGTCLCSKCNYKRTAMGREFAGWPIPEFSDLSDEDKLAFWRSGGGKVSWLEKLRETLTKAESQRRSEYNRGEFQPLGFYKNIGYDPDKIKDTTSSENIMEHDQLGTCYRVCVKGIMVEKLEVYEHVQQMMAKRKKAPRQGGDDATAGASAAAMPSGDGAAAVDNGSTESKKSSSSSGSKRSKSSSSESCKRASKKKRNEAQKAVLAKKREAAKAKLQHDKEKIAAAKAKDKAAKQAEASAKKAKVDLEKQKEAAAKAAAKAKRMKAGWMDTCTRCLEVVVPLAAMMEAQMTTAGWDAIVEPVKMRHKHSLEQVAAI